MAKLLSLWLLWALATSIAWAEEEPLPLGKTVTPSRTGVTYFVEGRQTIAWGTEITIPQGARLVGRPGSVLVVEGSLQVRGADLREVVIENLLIEPGARFEEIRLDTVLFTGGGLKTGATPADGHVVIENSDLNRGTHLDLTMTGGHVDLLNATFHEPVRIRAAAPEGGRCTVKVNLSGCYYDPGRRQSKRSSQSGFVNGLAVQGIPDAAVRNCRLSGDKAEFVDCACVTFDGNVVNTAELVFRQSAPGAFLRTKVQKCDIYTPRVVFHAPPGKSKERVPLDRCWFRGLTRSQEISERIIRDGNDEAQCGVYVVLGKVNDRPLELAGKAGE
jgi:hypothetical protein